MYAREQSLNGIWTLYIAEHSEVRRYSEPLCTQAALNTAGFLKLNGSVPGNFELDLQTAGLLEDPFFGTNPLSGMCGDLRSRGMLRARFCGLRESTRLQRSISTAA